MKRILIALSAFAIVLLSFSFSTSENNSWKLHTEIDGIKIYTQEVSCELRPGVNNNYLLFKYENTNVTAKELSWRMDLYYNGVCRACNVASPSAYDIQLNLPANATKEGDCSSTSFGFKVFYSDDRDEYAPLDKFEFTNLYIR